MRASSSVIACLLAGCGSSELVVHLRVPGMSSSEIGPARVAIGRRGGGGEAVARMVETSPVSGSCHLALGMQCWGAMSRLDSSVKNQPVGSGCRESPGPVECTELAVSAAGLDVSALRADREGGTTLLVVLEHRWPWSSALVSSVSIGGVELERRQGIPASSEWWAIQASARIVTYCLLSAERDRIAPADQPLALDLGFRLLEGVYSFTAMVDRVNALPDVGFVGNANFEELDYLVGLGTPELREIGVATCSPASR